MSSLSRELRNDLARATTAARSRAEVAARAALENLAVHERQARAHMDEPKRQLRTALRARGKALGDSRAADGSQELTRLLEHTAYEHWHRLLFTRFLTENHLLLMPDEAGGAPTPVTVEECDELAPELGAKDGFDLACRFAGKTLPGVFRADDPVLQLTFAPEGQVALRTLLNALPGKIFTADDALGWTYQFWQAQRKEEVNASGNKIGAAELSPVTQLFTEDYMVEFLLHNTLGAWWAGRCATLSNFKAQISNAASEADARAAVALPPKHGAPGIDWSYLRFVHDETTKTWVPAAGTFTGWPKTVRELTMLDPSMGSGHFLVFALPLLVRLRMEEENLTPAAAVAAVLRDNLHGLELDERCTQIAAFNLALTAWKIAGYQPLPGLHLACSGLAPHASQAEWVALAGTDEKLQRGMVRLYQLFKDAPVLGSLINPRAAEGDLLVAAFHELQPLLEKALAQESSDDTAHELAVTARGLAKAAELLASQFTLVATNVPYLGRGKQDDVLKDYCERVHPEAKADLATCFVERCLDFCVPSVGTTVLVTPQNWLFLGSYKHLRKSLLTDVTWDMVARLGPHAFATIGGEVVNVALLALTRQTAAPEHALAGWDAAAPDTPAAKADFLLTGPFIHISQAGQLGNPDAVVQLTAQSTKARVSDFAYVRGGTTTSDAPVFRRYHWEIKPGDQAWAFQQTTVDRTAEYAGRELVLLWEGGAGELVRRANGNGATIAGREVWGKRGVAISKMRDLHVTLYSGQIFENVAFILVPTDESHLPALWAFCSSSSFREAVRQVNQALCVDPGYYEMAPFDLAHWQKVAAEKYPKGLPKPYSSDPTQWLFNGHPAGSDSPLHVAVARLLGYQWPRQTGSSFPDCPALGPDGLESFSDDDGIVCLPPLNREAPAAQRVRDLLAAALGKFDERALIAATDSSATTLEDWLRDDFFAQHCALFHHRPFVWHVWDGRKDGFHALVNYHKLDHATLNKLTFSYLGTWISDQANDAKADKPGAAARLGTAQALQNQLKAILEGEAPYDIFVRWKPLNQQALGWNPDLNDGVRLNIRPFLLAGDVGKKGAGILRAKPNVKWDKDRGKEPERAKAAYPWFWCEEEPTTNMAPEKTYPGHRWNAVHLPLATKRAARG